MVILLELLPGPSQGLGGVRCSRRLQRGVTSVPRRCEKLGTHPTESAVRAWGELGG